MENRIDIGIDNRTLIFRFRYDPDIISYLKQLKCRWHPQEKYWYIYLDFISPDIIQVLMDTFYFDVKEDVLSYIKSYHRKYIYLSSNKKYFIYHFPINDEIRNYLQNKIGVLWSEKNKVWYSPILVTPFIIKYYNVLKNMGFSFDPELQQFLKNFNNKDIALYLNEKYPDTEVDELIPEGLSLRQYQKLAVKFIWDQKRVLIGDEMGLGKTIETIVALNKNFKEKTPILVVTRTVAVLNWAYEFLKWNPSLAKEKIFVVSSNYMINKKNKDILSGRAVPLNYDVYITNYEMLSILLDDFSKIKFKTLIIDESHRIRHTTRREIIKGGVNNDTKTKKVPVKRTKALLTVGKYSEYLIALSGTPLVNRPMDMYVMLKIINPEIFSNKFIFGKMFCNGILTKWGWDFKGYSNLRELNYLLTKTIMIRRRSVDVLLELPEKQRTILPIQVETKNDLKMLNSYIERFNENTNHIIEHNKIGTKLTLTAKKLIFSEISKMQNEIFKIKFPLVTSFIKTIIEEKGKCLLYVYYHNAFYIVEKWLKQNNIKYETIIGTKDVHDYYNAVKNFQENKDVKVMLLTIGAGSEAITLTASSTVIFLQFDWSPTVMQQAEDRVHRIGQKNAVNAYYIVLDNSCDVSIIHMLSQKFKVVNTAIDGYTEDTLNSELFDTFLDLFMKNKGLVSKYEPISLF